MAEILHHLGCMKPYKYWDKLPISWCRISAINSSNQLQGTIGCTPNSVPMVFIVFILGILGDNLPINTHDIGLYRDFP